MFGFIKKSLTKTVEAIKSIAPTRKEKIDKDTLEEILIEADVEYDLIEQLLEDLPSSVTRERLEKKLLECFVEIPAERDTSMYTPFVQLIIGVNGAGKTTTIAKLANMYKKDGGNVMLGAGDTFRAAAIEQLSRWAAKLDVPIIASKQGHDPSAIAFDAISSAKAKGFNNVVIDTAGRLHTQVNLSNELKKIVRVSDKAMEGAPHEKLLIIDGTQGNSAINQAKAFHDMVGVDGIIITKLDGTAKGGAIFSIASNLKIPIYYIGTGESPDDIAPFDKNEFVNTILDELYTVEENNG